MEKRTNPRTGKVEIKLQPEGLPEIWVERGYICERCKPFGECLGLDELSDEEWQGAQEFIKSGNNSDEAKLKIKEQFETKPCALKLS